MSICNRYLSKIIKYFHPNISDVYTNKNKGFYMYFNLFFMNRRYLRESLKMANSEDLNRLTSCSLVLLGHIFLSLGSPREASNMVSPAMQLASKIPDLHLQLWASAILKGLHSRYLFLLENEFVLLFLFFSICLKHFQTYLSSELIYLNHQIYHNQIECRFIIIYI